MEKERKFKGLDPRDLNNETIYRIKNKFPYIKSLEIPLYSSRLVACLECGRESQKVAQSGNQTRIFGIYQCSRGHLFTFG